jgi:hypothetical protein
MTPVWPVPQPMRTRRCLTEPAGALGHRHCLQRAILLLDKDIHRPKTVRCHCGPLTFAGHIIETGSTSHRLAPARNARPAS